MAPAFAPRQLDSGAPAATSAEVTNFMKVFPAFMPERHRIEGHGGAFFNFAAPGMPPAFSQIAVFRSMEPSIRVAVKPRLPSLRTSPHDLHAPLPSLCL